MLRTKAVIAFISGLAAACARVPYTPTDAGPSDGGDAQVVDGGPLPARCIEAEDLPERGGTECSTVADCPAGEGCPEGGGRCIAYEELARGMEAVSISDDGRVALVQTREDDTASLQRWTRVGGLEPLPLAPYRVAHVLAHSLLSPDGQVDPAILSGDGRVIFAVHSTEAAPEIVRWDGATERRWTVAPEPNLSCGFVDVTFDGSAAIGTCFVNGAGDESARFYSFRVRNDELEPLRWNDEQCEVIELSADGDTVLGVCLPHGGPVLWDRAGAVRVLSGVEGTERVMAHAISDDGAIVVGGARIDDEGPGPTVWRPMRWVCGVPHLLPLPAGARDAVATDTNADGAVVVGLARRTVGDHLGDWDAMFRWSADGGTERLRNLDPAEPTWRAYTDPRGELAFTDVGYTWTAPGYSHPPSVPWQPRHVSKSRRAFSTTDYPDVDANGSPVLIPWSQIYGW